MLFHRIFIPILSVVALASAGCLQPGDIPDADPIATPDASVDAPAATSPPCSNEGSGRLRVSVSLDPALMSRTADVWLAVQCDDGGGTARPVRLVRWDGSATQTLDGFGPGTYRVFGSTFLSPGNLSTMTLLGSASTSAVSLALGAEGPVLARVASSSATGADAGYPDAGAPDAGVAASDAALAAPGWSARGTLRETPSGPSIGMVNVNATVIDASTIEVRVIVQNVCAQAPCMPLTLHSIEVRSLDGDTPVGFAVSDVATPRLDYGAAVSTPLRLRGVLPDARHTLQIAIFAESMSATRPTGRP